MPAVPHDPALDSTLSLLREGYTFISSRCQRFTTDIFTTRLLGQRAVCIHGREAAEIFYDETKFMRQGAVPRRVVSSLFGKGGLQGLDGAEHRRRKAAFLSLMTPANLERLLEITGEEWRLAIRAWEARTTPIVLFDEAQLLLTRAVCRWAGVPISSNDERQRAADFGAMVDAFGGAGPRLWRGKLARSRAEQWIERLIELTRAGAVAPHDGEALKTMSELRDDSGQLLGPRVAGVELINVLRPTAAIAWYICFTALALSARPDLRPGLKDDSAYRERGLAEQFMQEVRRFYPFTPFLGAKVRSPFTWNGYSFEPGTLVLLDVYGTNHDSRIYPAPGRFEPARFADGVDDDFGFIPQGGGDAMGHRCAGEWVTRYNLQLALHFLTRGMSYELEPTQDLRFDLRRMPTRPKSGVILRNIVASSALDEPAPRLAGAHSAGKLRVA